MINFFLKRIIAYIADFFVVSAFMWILSFILYIIANPYGIHRIYSYFVYLVPILCILYFSLCEYYKGSTIGKALMFLKVKSKRGRHLKLSQAIIRNITKIFWFPIIFDLLIGMILRKDDRIFNLISETAVVEE